MVPQFIHALRSALGAVLLFTLAPLAGQATSPPPRLISVEAKPNWETSLQHVAWRKRDGAPAAAVAMTQDSRGMLWFATGEGLYRFDGVRFDRMDAIDGHPLQAADIAAVAAYGDALWVGYRFGGASVFENGKATHYGEAQGVPQRSAQGFARTGDGVMWLATYVGVFRRDGERWSRVGADDGLPPLPIRSFTVTPGGALVAYMADGLYLKPANSRRFARVAGLPVIESGDLRDDGRILLKTDDRQLFVFDPVTGAVAPLTLTHFHQPRLDVMQEKGGAMWISSPQGLHLLDPSLTLQKTYSMANGFSGRIVHAFLQDREGNTWFTTESGVDRISEGRINKLEPLGRQSLFMNVLAGDDGDVWVGSSSDMSGYDDTLYRVGADGSHTATPIRRTTASTRARDGTTWFAGRGVLWRVRDGQYRHWNLPADLRADVQAMAVDVHGVLWLSIIGVGMHTFRDGVWGRPAVPELAARTAISLHVDGQGDLWFGYPQNAMAVLAPDGALRRFGTAQGLDVGNVLVINSRRDSGGAHLWIGGDRGFGYWDGARFRPLRGRAGPAIYGVSGILENARGDVWLHGAGGIVHILASDLVAAMGAGAAAVPVERFDYLDGYEGTAAQLRPIPTLTEATDGRIWYATAAHVGWIDPRRITYNPLAPTPQITALQTKRHAYAVNGAVTLPPGTDDIQIDFTAAVLTIPERARFRYRLVGLDAGWRETDVRRQAFYTNMAPGAYRFEVQACNEDGVWSTQTAQLAVTIAPTIVETVWFKLLCVLMLALAGYGLFRWRVQRVTARVTAQMQQRMQERMEERLGERTRIARTLHDSFLQSVQALIMRFDRIKSRMPADDPLQGEIDCALASADAVLGEGREQVWALRSGDNVQVELAALLREATVACERQYGVQVHIEPAGEQALLADAVQREVFAIAMEAVHNAGRHAGADTVHIALEHLPRSLTLRITDNGCGIDEQVLVGGAPPGHWGLAGMRERAQLIGATLHIGRRVQGGTEVRLTVPLAA